MKTKMLKTKMLASLITGLTAVAFLAACGEDKPSAADEDDCFVKAGVVKVFSPRGGEVFHVGDTITVKFAANYGMGTGFRIRYYAGDLAPVDLTEESVGPEAPDGKRCYEEKVVLKASISGFVASDEAYIRVHDYSSQTVGDDSKTFKVIE